MKTNISYLKLVRFWNEDDRQTALDYLKENPEEEKKFRKAIKDSFADGIDYCDDESALNHIVTSHDESLFGMFDTAVADEFVSLFKNTFLK